MLRMRLLFLAALACAALANPINSVAQDNQVKADVPVQYSATAFFTSGGLNGKSFGLKIYINGFSSPAEVQQVATTLQKDGPDAVLKILEKMDNGGVAPTGSVRTKFAVIYSKPTATGVRIVMLTDRKITFPEARYSTRSKDYKFGIVVLNLDRNGKGTGSMAPACKIKFNKKNELQIEHYGQNPLRLANVEKLK